MSSTQSYREIIQNRIKNRGDVFLAVIGPCSIYDEKETLEYESKLKDLQKQLGSSIFLVMRAFVEKSRTSQSWRGFVYQPDLSCEENIFEGIKKTKKLFSKMRSPLAMEFIDPSIYPFLAPYISWGFIGARTVTSSTHRILVSNSTIPFGFKNSLDGNVLAPVHGCIVSQSSHCILENKGQTFTKGNPYTHVVLRGGENQINYSRETIQYVNTLTKKYKINSPILIDCSHGNCLNKPEDQKIAFLHALEMYIENPTNILGVMIESNIFGGASKDKKIYGVSITDPCLSFEQTKQLLLFAKEKIKSSKNLLATTWKD
jgi:3-deoxy-7-phosphoheptulonate synthase